MTTFAAEVAAKLQRAGRREDKDMGKDSRTLDDDPYTRIHQLHEMVLAAALEIQNSDENAGRVAELEQKIARAYDEIGKLSGQLQGALYDRDQRTQEMNEAHEAHRQVIDRGEKTERRLKDALARIDDLDGQFMDALARERELDRRLIDALTNAEVAESMLAAAYVVREVPWSDVAAGMMTIARDGTPWMVEGVGGDPKLTVTLVNGGQSFPKNPKKGETVRVLVPYVTPEQAEALVASELGGRA